MSETTSGLPNYDYHYTNPPQGFENIGKRGLGRVDGVMMASGRAEFTRDVNIPNQLYAKSYRSPYPHAKITSMDTSAAEALPGVHLVLRYDDPKQEWLPNTAQYGSTCAGTFTGCMGDTAHHEGMPVGAMVVAESPSLCDYALSLISVEWEQLPWGIDHDEILAPGATLLYPELSESNVALEETDGRGDVEQGFAECDHTLEFTFTKQTNGHAGTQGAASVSEWRGDEVDLWFTGQFPQATASALSDPVFGIPTNKSHVMASYEGGSFGRSINNWVGAHLAPMSAVLSRRVGRPVKFLFDDSHPYIWGELGGSLKAKVGYNNDGQIIAVESIGTSDYRVMVSMGAVDKMKIHTNIPHIKQINTMPYRNKMSSCTLRDGGGPVGFANFVYQRVAAALGKDPTEIAMINNGSDGSKQNYADAVAARGQPGRDSLEECIAAGKEAFGWDEKWHEPGAKKLPNGKMHGISFAWAEEWSHRPMYTQAQIIVGFDGKVRLSGRRMDTGTDCRSAYARMIADEMGVRFEDVIVDIAHDDGTVELACPAGSGGMYKSGMAIIDAAHKARQQIFEMATSTGSFEGAAGLYLQGSPVFPGLTADELDMKGGLVFEKANPENAKPLALVAFFMEGAYGAEYYRAGKINVIGSTLGQLHHEFLCRQCHFAEVEVDTDTGQVEVTKVVNVNDVGKAIHPDSLNGQQYGGSYMGIGIAAYDRAYFDPQSGVLLNENLIDYKWPSLLDIGQDMDQVLIESGLGNGPYGLMGIGEQGSSGTLPLIHGAIYNATGKWVDEYPANPEVVLKALGKV